MRNIKLTIEYDGTRYCGWQVQSNGVTVQAVLQKAISKMTGGSKVTLYGASRTDAGVHSLGQTANFHTTSKITRDGFLRGLNSILPDDISIRDVEEVPLAFHSRRSAKRKHYRYLIYCDKPKLALLRNRAWYLQARPDVKIMNGAAKALVGIHDFSSFCASGDTNRSKEREIKSISVRNDRVSCFNLIVIDVIGTGFLKYMVRNIVGTLIKVGSRTEMKAILESKDRNKAGVTAPAQGLYLLEVLY